MSILVFFYLLCMSVFFGGLFYSIDIVEWFRSRICVCPRCRRFQRVIQLNYISEYVRCDGCGTQAVRYFRYVHIRNGKRIVCERDVWRDRYSAKTFMRAV